MVYHLKHHPFDLLFGSFEDWHGARDQSGSFEPHGFPLQSLPHIPSATVEGACLAEPGPIVLVKLSKLFPGYIYKVTYFLVIYIYI